MLIVKICLKKSKRLDNFRHSFFALSAGPDASATIVNNIICHNSAYVGGGITTYALVESHHKIINNIIFENSASHNGGGINCFDPVQFATITNTVVWGNTPDEIYDKDEAMTITYCVVKGGWPGTGNIDADPLFLDPDNNDYHLQQDPCQAGINSPCVDSGDPDSFGALRDDLAKLLGLAGGNFDADTLRGFQDQCSRRDSYSLIVYG